MNKLVFPDWALKYKVKGTSLRYSHGSIQLYKVSSHREKGYKYPITEQEFIGTITEEGIVYKKVKETTISFIEYGLSFFIYNHYHRELTRCIYGYQSELKEATIIYSIIKYVFNYVDEFIINHCLLGIKYKNLLLPLLKNENKTIKTLVNKIPTFFEKEFNENSYKVEAYLRTLSCNSKTKYEDIKLSDLINFIKEKIYEE